MLTWFFQKHNNYPVSEALKRCFNTLMNDCTVAAEIKPINQRFCNVFVSKINKGSIANVGYAGQIYWPVSVRCYDDNPT